MWNMFTDTVKQKKKKQLPHYSTLIRILSKCTIGALTEKHKYKRKYILNIVKKNHMYFTAIFQIDQHRKDDFYWPWANYKAFQLWHCLHREWGIQKAHHGSLMSKHAKQRAQLEVSTVTPSLRTTGASIREGTVDSKVDYQQCSHATATPDSVIHPNTVTKVTKNNRIKHVHPIIRAGFEFWSTKSLSITQTEYHTPVQIH